MSRKRLMCFCYYQSVLSSAAMNSPEDHDQAINSDRRKFLKLTSCTLISAAWLANSAPAQDISKVQKAERSQSANDIGPENLQLKQASPNAFLPPSTDHGEVRTFWSSFSTAHRRIQEGGWSRYVTVENFPISTDIAGVNMRLTAIDDKRERLPPKYLTFVTLNPKWKHHRPHTRSYSLQHLHRPRSPPRRRHQSPPRRRTSFPFAMENDSAKLCRRHSNPPSRWSAKAAPI